MAQLDLEKREIELDGVRFPILGPVHRLPVSPFAAKITVGDYSRDSEVVASSWVQSDWSGGFGVEYGTYPRDQDRFWMSSCETRWIRHLSLPPAITTLGTVTDLPVRPLAAGPYFASGPALYRIQNGTVVLVKSYGQAITDLCWDGSALWIGTPSLVEVTPDGQAFTTHPVSGIRLAELGGWIYAVGSDQVLRAYNRTSWNDVTTVPFPVLQLLTFRDAVGDPALYALAQDGLWVLDRAVNRFFKTPLSWPPSSFTGFGTVWRGELFLPVGSSILHWTGATVSPAGPDRDQGLPEGLSTRVRAVAGTFGYLVAALSGTVSADPMVPPKILELGLPPELEPALVGRATSGPLFLLVSSGGGWHYLALDPTPSTFLGVVADNGTEWVIWVDGNRTVKGVAMFPQLHNPLHATTVPTADRGELVTPWFDAGWVEVDKVALRARVGCLRASPDLPVRLDLQTDQDPNWVMVGQVTQPGETVFDLKRLDGYPIFRRLRFRLVLERRRGEATTTPVVEYYSLAFLRRPRQYWAFNTTLDLSGEWRGKSPDQLRDHLLQVAERADPVLFRYPDGERPFLVVLSRLQWAAVSGLEAFQGEAAHQGRAAVSFLEVG